MNCHCGFVILIICICVLESTILSVSGVCHMDQIKSGCTDPNESCYQQNSTTLEGICKCKEGYVKRDYVCTLIATTSTANPHGSDSQPVTPTPSDSSSVSGSTIAASILIPLVLIVTAAALVYSARRYQWLHRLHQLRQRRYDEVRIGQEDDDDPPIA